MASLEWLSLLGIVTACAARGPAPVADASADSTAQAELPTVAPADAYFLAESGAITYGLTDGNGQLWKILIVFDRWGKRQRSFGAGGLEGDTIWLRDPGTLTTYSTGFNSVHIMPWSEQKNYSAEERRTLRDAVPTAKDPPATFKVIAGLRCIERVTKFQGTTHSACIARGIELEVHDTFPGAPDSPGFTESKIALKVDLETPISETAFAIPANAEVTDYRRPNADNEQP